MDRNISDSVQSKAKIKNYISILIVLALLTGAYFVIRKNLQKRIQAKDLHIVKVERGNIKSTLTATGTIIAATERVINAPVSTEIENVLLTTGAKVSKGDLILTLDQEYTQLAFERLEDELSLRENSISKLKLQYDKDLRELDYRDQIKALQLSELEAKLGDQKRLFEIGGATAEEVEAADLQNKIAKIEKKILENELQFKRQVNTSEKNQLQLEFNIQGKRLKELGSKLKETKVKSPDNGVITWINENIGKTVVEGEPLVRIANLNRFEVEAITSDRNSKKLQLGMPVELKINKERLNGTISRILPEITNNTIKFYIDLEINNHQSLRPNLKAEVFVITDEKENVLRAKRGHALQGTKTQFFYKVSGEQAVKTRITKGLISSEYFEIEAGLEEGDEIIISDMAEFKHMEKFQIKH